MPSDPEAVSRWFADVSEALGSSGRQLRRVSRYLKAWREYHWPNGGGPSSVLLMIAIAQKFCGKPRRDDLAVEDAAEILSITLAGDVGEKAIHGEKEDFNRIDDSERREAAIPHHRAPLRRFGRPASEAAASAWWRAFRRAMDILKTPGFDPFGPCDVRKVARRVTAAANVALEQARAKLLGLPRALLKGRDELFLRYIKW